MPTDFVFCAPMFHLLHCFLCIPCNANLLLTSILIVHYLHFAYKYILMAAWGSGGEEASCHQGGRNEPDFDRFGG